MQKEEGEKIEHNTKQSMLLMEITNVGTALEASGNNSLIYIFSCFFLRRRYSV